MKPRTRNSVEEIEQFVSRGHSQSAANCRVLLDEINRLRALIANKEDAERSGAGVEIEKLLQLIETAHEHANEIWIVEQAAKVRAALPSHKGAALSSDKGEER